MKAIAERLEALYRALAEGPMAGLPICNPRLGVAAVGFRPYAGEAVGVVLTPWFMNVVAAPLQPKPATLGSSRKLGLPGGEIELIVGELPGFGRLDAASLFSPCHEFEEAEAALAAAEAAAEALFAVPEAPKMDRRAFLRGARA